MELLASCIAMDAWAPKLMASFPVLFGDNDSVRFALIRGTGMGKVASTTMQLHLENEVAFNTNVWFARVPTEANIADIPSRFASHPLLLDSLESSSCAFDSLMKFLDKIKQVRNELIEKGEQFHLDAPRSKKMRVRI